MGILRGMLSHSANKKKQLLCPISVLEVLIVQF